MAKAPADDQAPEEGSIPFVLDGRPATARPGELLISAAERAGTFIPRFCYHPRMKPVGMCRMCLVEVSGPRGATLQPACFITVSEGAEVTTTSAKVQKAQDGVLELLLVNHPLDCPVCDKGGECPLQDQTLAYGPGESRFIEEKRHFEKPIALSELVLLDRERCIQCARCTRFAEEVAGEAQIDFAGRGERVEVATFPGQPFSSYFSGNTVQICPVGALTATPYRFAARPWDLDQVESTCTTCAVGCRTAVQSSANRLTRLLGIDSDPVNHGWLCDKGRFIDVAPEVADFPAVAEGSDEDGPVRRPGHGARVSQPLVRKGEELVAVGWGEALAAAARGLRRAADGGPGSIGVLGGARLTNEGAYAWAKLAKGALRTDSVDAQLGDGLPAEMVLGLPRATIDEAGAARVVVVVAGDLREELPIVFLRLREAATELGTAVIELSPVASSLRDVAAVSLAARPGDIPGLTRALLGDDGAASALRAHPEGAAWAGEELDRARRLLADLGRGEDLVVVLGRPSLAEDASTVSTAARLWADAFPGARFLPALRRGNVMGALDMGLAPGLLPGRVTLEAGAPWFADAWGATPPARGLDATGMLASLAAGEATVAETPAASRVRALLLVGADPLCDFPDRDLATRGLSAAEFVVAVCGHHSPVVDHADVVLPAAVAHERPGTTTNLEGRVSRLGQKLVAPGQAWPDWMIATELAAELGHDLGFSGPGDVWAEITELAPAYAGLDAGLLESDGAHDGLLVPLDGDGRSPRVLPIDPIALPGVESVERQGAPPRVGNAEAGDETPMPTGPGDLTPPPLLSFELDEERRVPPPDNYSLRLVATRRLYDAGTTMAASPFLAPLIPVLVARANPYDLDRLGLGTGDRVRVRSARGSLVLPAFADEGTPRGVVNVEFNLPLAADGAPDAALNAVAEIIDATAVVNDVRLESV